MEFRLENRREKIIEEIDQVGEINITELSKKMNVSQMTIRRDLKKLEEEGALIRKYKGAISVNQLNTEDTLKLRRLQNENEKTIIAKYAEELIENEDIIMLDASTTALAICKYIQDKKLTVVTNSISIATALSAAEKVNVILVGGNLRKSALSLVGPYALEGYKKLNITKAFISGKALSFSDGLTDVNIFEIESKQAAISRAKEINVLIDHTKLNKVSLFNICEYNKINRIIIDGLKEFSLEEEETINKFRHNGIEVIIAK
ncbi:DeoR/GlpR family DNA-binding transcription regulator [Clostridium ganghwense]|uniref:DeoR/GlpR family DNA-binding transcription regulator n=1 Tax=Clostridium ganghwense TaxID=312089 RepID=A0ABT4CJC7_9CLOT|nr:DeoR/GlpR family DNA-binding transcription regulator [Clostridium ganghwense]MCY6369147.1 DeoR/GlpR family DNA-binding transcription regulator [Clostridium ganghwense]